MNHPDVLVNVMGILYGVVLIFAAFARSAFTEAMRIDALFMRESSERTRPLNLLAGLLFAGYSLHALLSR